MPRPTDQALLLRRTPYGESSLVVHALTRRHGRVHLVAKGAYRRTSRFFCVLDLFHTLELTWSSKPGRELDPLSGGDILRRRRRLPLDAACFRSAATVLELLDLGAPKGRPEAGLFDLAQESLDALDQPDPGPQLAQGVLLHFQLGFLTELGLAPALQQCAACGDSAPGLSTSPDRAAFSAGAGGRLCFRCAAQARREGARVGTLPVTVLEATARAGSGTRVPPQFLEPCLDLASRFLDYHLDARLKSQRAFLAAPNRNAPQRPAPSREVPRTDALPRPH